MKMKALRFVGVILSITIMALTAVTAHADNNCMSVLGATDDPSASISYTPANSWHHDSGYFTKACNTTVSWSNASGATSISFTFNGSSITRKYTMASNRGSENVWIDGDLKSILTSTSQTT